MTQKELSVNRAFLKSVKASIVYQQIALVFEFPLAYRVVKYPDVEMFNEGNSIGDIKLKFNKVFVQLSGSKGVVRNALFIPIGKISYFL